MGTVIVVIVLIVIVLFAMRGSFKHMKGEGGCCGGSAPKKVKKQKLTQVAETKTMKIEGMTCDNCRKRVENALNSLTGVNASVNLSRKEAVVKMEKALSDEILKKAVEELGYQVKTIL